MCSYFMVKKTIFKSYFFMKILKSIFILVFFSNLIISCTADDIEEEQEMNTTEKEQSTNGSGEDLDQTEKGE